jgi:transcriptional regulator with XRE-family HTH domain
LKENAVKFVRNKLKEKFREQHKLLSYYLRLARENARMTQHQAGAQMGRDQTYIAKLESGAQRPLFVEVEQLAKTYGKELSFFVTIDDVEHLNPDLIVPPNVLRYSRPRPGEKDLRLKRNARRAANRAKRSKRTKVLKQRSIRS